MVTNRSLWRDLIIQISFEFYDQRLINAGTLHLLYMQYHPGGTLADVVRVVRQVPAHERSGRLLLDRVDTSLLHAAQVIPDRSATREWLNDLEWPMLVAWIGMQILRGLQAGARSAGFASRYQTSKCTSDCRRYSATC